MERAILETVPIVRNIATNASAKRAIVQIWTIADPKISILDNSVFILDNRVFLLVTRGEEGW